MRRIFLFATLLVTGVMSANSGHSTLKERKVLKTKKVRKASVADCFPVYYHGCIHATACVSSIEEGLKWSEKIHENYCNK